MIAGQASCFSQAKTLQTIQRPAAAGKSWYPQEVSQNDHCDPRADTTLVHKKLSIYVYISLDMY